MRNSIFILIFAILLGFQSTSEAQALKITAGNTLIGTVNGAVLGLGLMGLKNDSDFTPVRFGVGAGTLFGLGVGIYDVSKLDGIGFYYVDGLFNSAEYSALIVLLDTAYGSVTGSVLGMAIALMANENVVRYMQYGASAGAFAGFTFGLADAFYFSNSPASISSLPSTQRGPEGLLNLSYSTKSDTGIEVGFINPTLTKSIGYNNGLTLLNYRASVQLVNLKVSF